MCLPYSVKVTFDGKYQVEHEVSDKNIPNNLCSEGSYTLTSKEKYKQYYTYAFTDADYEYAVAVSGGTCLSDKSINLVLISPRNRKYSTAFYGNAVSHDLLYRITADEI